MTEQPDSGDGPANPPASDPWKSFRGVMAATLLLEAIVVLLLPPSPEVQAGRLQGRGDSAEHVAQRIKKGVDEVRSGMEIAQHVVVNNDVEQAMGEVAGIVDRARSSRRPL